MTKEDLQAERDSAAATLAQLERQAGELQQAANDNMAERLHHAGAVVAYDKMLAMMEPEPVEVGNGAGAG